MGPYESSLHTAHQERRAKFWPEIPVNDSPTDEPVPVDNQPAKPQPVRWMESAPEGFEFPVSDEEQAEKAVIEKRATAAQVRAIIKMVSEDYGVTAMDILSARRTKNLVRPRHLAMYLAKRTTLRSFPDIGRRFGGRDHTTILHAVNKIEAEIASDPKFAERAAKLEALLSQ